MTTSCSTYMLPPVTRVLSFLIFVLQPPRRSELGAVRVVWLLVLWRTGPWGFRGIFSFVPPTPPPPPSQGRSGDFTARSATQACSPFHRRISAPLSLGIFAVDRRVLPFSTCFLTPPRWRRVVCLSFSAFKDTFSLVSLGLWR